MPASKHTISTAAVDPAPDCLASLLGDPSPRAFQALYVIAAPILLGYLLQILHDRAQAEECLQEAFVKIWQRAGTFKAERGQAIVWMKRIARNQAFDLCRRLKAERAATARLPEPELMAIKPVWSRILILNMQLGFDSLTVAQRSYFKLAFLDGETYLEIARLTGAPIGSVKSDIRRGLIVLRGGIDVRKAWIAPSVRSAACCAGRHRATAIRMV